MKQFLSEKSHPEFFRPSKSPPSLPAEEKSLTTRIGTGQPRPLRDAPKPGVIPSATVLQHIATPCNRIPDA